MDTQNEQSKQDTLSATYDEDDGNTHEVEFVSCMDCPKHDVIYDSDDIMIYSSHLNTEESTSCHAHHYPMTGISILDSKQVIEIVYSQASDRNTLSKKSGTPVDICAGLVVCNLPPQQNIPYIHKVCSSKESEVAFVGIQTHAKFRFENPIQVIPNQYDAGFLISNDQYEQLQLKMLYSSATIHVPGGSSTFIHNHHRIHSKLGRKLVSRVICKLNHPIDQLIIKNNSSSIRTERMSKSYNDSSLIIEAALISSFPDENTQDSKPNNAGDDKDLVTITEIQNVGSSVWTGVICDTYEPLEMSKEG